MAMRTLMVMAVVAVGVASGTEGVPVNDPECFTDVTGERFCRCVTVADCGSPPGDLCTTWGCKSGWCRKETATCLPVPSCADGSRPTPRPGACCATEDDCPKECETASDCKPSSSDPCVDTTCQAGKCVSSVKACPPPSQCPDGSIATPRPGECCPSCPPCTGVGCPCQSCEDCGESSDPCRVRVCRSGKCVEVEEKCPVVTCPGGKQPTPKAGKCCAEQDDCPKCEETTCPCTTVSDCGSSSIPCTQFRCIFDTCRLFHKDCPDVVCPDGSVPPTRPGECCPFPEDCPKCVGAGCPCSVPADCGTSTDPCMSWGCVNNKCHPSIRDCAVPPPCPDGSSPVPRPGECCPTECPPCGKMATSCEQPADPCKKNVCLNGGCVVEEEDCPAVVCSDGKEAKPKAGTCCATQDDCPKCEGVGCLCMSTADCGKSSDPCKVLECSLGTCLLRDNCPRVVCSDGSVPPKRPGECCPLLEDCPKCTGKGCPCTAASDCPPSSDPCIEVRCLLGKCSESLMSCDLVRCSDGRVPTPRAGKCCATIRDCFRPL